MKAHTPRSLGDRHVEQTADNAHRAPYTPHSADAGSSFFPRPGTSKSEFAWLRSLASLISCRVSEIMVLRQKFRPTSSDNPLKIFE